ncbi:hypothetical protein QVD17_19097 [Tagetes erecta]|uniref:HAT C-terminal dimerisation domain-containing protein n=1 Tax=Tagetes erecta TaxID=13708 RepID=A0AAD8KJ98_TARER|nr:hypothetical protein QVD17_19097 [Tagetes erecta]
MKDPKKNFLNVVWESVAKKHKGAAPSSELYRYSGIDYTSTMLANDIDSFYILAWWKGREVKFPVLSAVSRDLLSSQAFTVALESVFSTCGRVISLRRTILSPKAMEILYDEEALEGQVPQRGGFLFRGRGYDPKKGDTLSTHCHDIYNVTTNEMKTSKDATRHPSSS